MSAPHATNYSLQRRPSPCPLLGLVQSECCDDAITNRKIIHLYQRAHLPVRTTVSGCGRYECARPSGGNDVARYRSAIAACPLANREITIFPDQCPSLFQLSTHRFAAGLGGRSSPSTALGMSKKLARSRTRVHWLFPHPAWSPCVSKEGGRSCRPSIFSFHLMNASRACFHHVSPCRSTMVSTACERKGCKDTKMKIHVCSVPAASVYMYIRPTGLRLAPEASFDLLLLAVRVAGPVQLHMSTEITTCRHRFYGDQSRHTTRDQR